MCCTLKKKKITSALFKYDQPNIYTFHLGILSALTSRLTCVVRTHLRQLSYFIVMSVNFLTRFMSHMFHLSRAFCI